MLHVTTLIPAYNAAAFVRQAVDSALGQRNVRNEVIVIDDGSTDSTPEVLGEYGGRIRVIRQANCGHVKSRNNGARIAQGEWVAFLDADDEWLPAKLEMQLARADDKTHMVYTDRVNFGAIERVGQRQSDVQTLHEGDAFEHLLLCNFVTVSSAIMRKSVYDRFGGFEESLKVCEDWDLWLRYTAEGGRMGLVREPLTRYRWSPDAMTQNYQRMLDGRLIVLDRAMKLPRAQNLPRSLVRRAYATAWETSAWYAAPRQKKTALCWYWQAAKLWPWRLETYKGMVKCLLGRG